MDSTVTKIHKITKGNTRAWHRGYLPISQGQLKDPQIIQAAVIALGSHHKETVRPYCWRCCILWWQGHKCEAGTNLEASSLLDKSQWEKGTARATGREKSAKSSERLTLRAAMPTYQPKCTHWYNIGMTVMEDQWLSAWIWGPLHRKEFMLGTDNLRFLSPKHDDWGGHGL